MIVSDTALLFLSGFVGVLFLYGVYRLGHHFGFTQGYGSGQHDREHWETDKIVEGKLLK